MASEQKLPDDYRIIGQHVSDYFIFRRGSCCTRKSNSSVIVPCVGDIQTLGVVAAPGNISQSIIDHIYYYNTITDCSKSPVPRNYLNADALDDILFDRQQLFKTCRETNPYYTCMAQCMNKYDPQVCLSLVAGVVFHKLTDTRYSFDIQYQPSRFYIYRDTFYMRYAAIISHAIWRMTGNYNGVNAFTFVRAMQFPTLKSKENEQSTMDTSLAVALASFLFLPLALQFLFPMYLSDRVQEDKSTTREYLKMFGVTTLSSDAVQYLFDYLLYLAVVFFTIVVGLSSGYAFFKLGNPSHYIVLFSIWGHTQIALANVLRHIVRTNANTAAVLGYVYILASMVVAGVCNVFLFNTGMPPWWYLLNPPFVLYRCFAIIMFVYFGTDEMIGTSLTYDKQLFSLYSILLAQTMLMLMIGIAIREFSEKKVNWTKMLAFLYPSIHLPERVDSSNEDEDVAHERERIQSRTRDGFLTIKGVSKSFNKRKIVNDLYLALDNNECFGLLGTNGAGKTSLIHMISSFFAPDSGTITVDNLSLSSAHKHHWISICPQFDQLFDNVTTQDHLLFLTRLKGLPNENQHVQDLLKEMGLEESRRRFAQDLSGGMKRRLSIAMALTGSPRVVLLDEPTTGLDPASRRDVWSVINNAVKKDGRCVLLTTHAMEEAEALCNRIGIMKKGKLRCLGSIHSLKDRFTSQYKISVSIQKISCELELVEPDVISFVLENLPSATIEYQTQSYYVFRVKKVNVKLSKLFTVMDSQQERKKFSLSKQDGYSLCWSVSCSSLEELFLKIVKPNLILET